jgi:hypothetical protein
MPESEACTGIKEFLEMQVNHLKTGNFPKIGHYFGWSDFILQHGISFDATDLPEQYERGAPKECFANAYQAAGDHWNLVYCEGYACGLIPVHHAWCVDQETRSVVEVTWTRDNTFEYLGIPMNFHYVTQAIARKGTHGVIDDWKNEWPMLKDDRSQWLHPNFR